MTRRTLYRTEATQLLARSRKGRKRPAGTCHQKCSERPRQLFCDTRGEVLCGGAVLVDTRPPLPPGPHGRDGRRAIRDPPPPLLSSRHPMALTTRGPYERAAAPLDCNDVQNRFCAGVYNLQGRSLTLSVARNAGLAGASVRGWRSLTSTEERTSANRARNSSAEEGQRRRGELGAFRRGAGAGRRGIGLSLGLRRRS